ncbi:uncharacterized protein LOC108907420 [Anoplophora glabripennis]|uniref:uncharacterized protein LOC108907420 n=1 Tax=Anoplophora glabripennis TaxID=217634 RepID=UPI000874F1D3|nr:uncharacterized protein LOC108907420 [Anoplophora glabripennis]
MKWSLMLLFCMSTVNGFTVDVVNVTHCSASDEEVGELIWDISSEESVDQLLSGSFNIPVQLDDDAYVYYESHFWDEQKEEWVFIFDGIRSFCSSILTSLPYRKFRVSVEPNWPKDCPVPAGKYELEEFPISGQYAVLSDIKNVPPLVKHELGLWQDDDLILCRVVHTISSN